MMMFGQQMLIGLEVGSDSGIFGTSFKFQGKENLAYERAYDNETAPDPGELYSLSKGLLGKYFGAGLNTQVETELTDHLFDDGATAWSTTSSEHFDKIYGILKKSFDACNRVLIRQLNGKEDPAFDLEAVFRKAVDNAKLDTIGVARVPSRVRKA